ncbi:DUF6527 family protein [Antarcticimicrobium sediminis]|uniref:Uncharacterized protein n=1 Tax=Antarcticimicrobium sediminis TaxID=2546227 RepID=A0A4R5F0E8_9RHOB|nr:DUF6527 family protein [Antarcticimicrobium sediminis]TDE40938.1 hypothetical protein E1B25_01620 [Antarcticimicrobium sediminis]
MIRAIRYRDAQRFRQERLPGSTFFDLTQGSEEAAALWFYCPCGCGTPVRIPVGIRHKPAESPSWNWNGSLNDPTLSPSVNRIDCGWHGWLIDGYWQAC